MGIFNRWDKSQNAIGLGIPMVTALIAYPNKSKLRLAALLGLIEVLQYFSGYRFGDWQDGAADGVGILMGLVIAALLKKLFSKNLQLAKTCDKNE